MRHIDICNVLLTAMLTSAPLLLGTTCRANDDQRPSQKDVPPIQGSAPVERKTAFLGVIAEELPAYVLTHLPNVASIGQGELVRSVIPGSPASAAGLKEHDILLTYDDQKLFSSEQLLKLISSDQPGRDVSLEVLREGQKVIVKVRLGERPVRPRGALAFPGAGHRGAPGRPGLQAGERPGRSESGVVRPSWHHLDSISIKWLDGDQYHATLTHFVENGKLEKHEYRGTREELRKLIDADDDLKPNERHHLLRCLDIPDHVNPWKLFDDSHESGF